MTKKFSNYVRGEGTVPEGMVKGWKASKRKQQPNRGWGGVCRVAWAQLKTREFSDVACKQCDLKASIVESKSAMEQCRHEKFFLIG